MSKEKNDIKAKYGLKVNAYYDASDFKSENIIIGNAEDNVQSKDIIRVGDVLVEKLVFSEPGTYNIDTYKSLDISHDINLKFIHINLTLLSDNIEAKIASRGIIKGSIVDMCHKILNEGKNNMCDILLDILADENTNLIYRTNLINSSGDATMRANSVAKILNLDINNKLVVEPAVVMLGDASSSTHSMSVKNIDKNDLEYMLLYGLDINNYKDLVKNNYV